MSKARNILIWIASFLVSLAIHALINTSTKISCSFFNIQDTIPLVIGFILWLCLHLYVFMAAFAATKNTE